MTEFLYWDDQAVVAENPIVVSGLGFENAKAALSEITLNLWHPVTLWSHQLDVSLFGLNPDLHHFSALVHHGIACLSLWFALGSLRSAVGTRLLTRGISLFVCLLFLLHPAHVESWAWIAERKDLLSAIFGYLCLGFWARWNRTRARRDYTLAFVALALGLASKPSLVVWPVLLLLTCWWQTRRVDRRDLKGILPFALIALACAMLTWYFQLQRGEAVLDVISTRSMTSNLIVGTTNLGLYLGRIFWPFNLSYFYPSPRETPWVSLVLSGLVIVSLSVLAYKLREKCPALMWSWASFLVILVPVCGFIYSGESNAPDRYTYLAYTGPFISLCLLARQFLPLRACQISASLCLLILGAATLQQAGKWKSMEQLCSQAIKRDPEANYAAHHHLSMVYLKGGQIQDALDHINRSLDIYPGNRYLWAQAGVIHFEQGDRQRAFQAFERQLVSNQDSTLALSGLVKIHLEAGSAQLATPLLERLITLVPSGPQRESYEQTLLALKENIGTSG